MDNIEDIRIALNKNVWLVAGIFFLVIFSLSGLVFYKYQKNKNTLIAEQLRASFMVYQTSLSEKLAIIANAPIFIKYLKSGEMTRGDLYVQFATNVLSLNDHAIIGSTIDYRVDDLLTDVESNKKILIYSYGKKSDTLIKLKLCYLNNILNRSFGICNHVWTLYFSVKNLYYDLNKINSNIVNCTKNCYTLSLKNQKLFGSFLLENNSNLSLNVALTEPSNDYIYFALAISLLLIIALIVFIRYIPKAFENQVLS